MQRVCHGRQCQALSEGWYIMREEIVKVGRVREGLPQVRVIRGWIGGQESRIKVTIL